MSLMLGYLMTAFGGVWIGAATVFDIGLGIQITGTIIFAAIGFCCRDIAEDYTSGHNILSVIAISGFVVAVMGAHIEVVHGCIRRC